MTIYSKDAGETQALGQSFPWVAAPAVIHLQGDLGAGKTTFIQGFVQGLGAHTAVLSPTYTLVEEYTTEKVRFTISIFIESLAPTKRVESLGLRDRCGPDDFVLIEWPDRGGDYDCQPQPGQSLWDYLDAGRSASIVKT